ncbi:transglutaminase domain-containing protein [Microvirga sp. ACRRW]|uniref:transglutaminase-like domain-containing protein n=1 Tax=Microvirga sp. ACRRW TaxID=2918205 RepID=UPI001EF5AD4E|nr:transglutaminase domain-containing protein [Microvirga sp. ACRRW]MCG7391642.1 transglutaminase domain-containing protein [Microvirga sp. ACRRW]
MKTRRDILLTGAAFSASLALPRSGFASPHPTGAWRRFDVATTLEIASPAGRAQAWIPLAGFSADDWARVEGNTWQTNAASVQVVKDATYGAKMLHAVWEDGTASPSITVTSRFATRDRHNDLSGNGKAAPLSDQERKLYLSPTALMPIDGAVKTLSDRITAGATGEIEKVRAIYEWMVENTFRRASTRGCGEGNVAAMLQANDFGGKCADLNGLFVALVRASGIPARDIYGVRVAPSKLGYKSLGANSSTITKSQHCRADVYLTGHGWVAMDPADVRKVMLEERPEGLPLDAPEVAVARKMLLGSWEGNWLPYNTAHDLILPGVNAPALGFFMYPQVETAAGRLDCLQPEMVKYVMTAAEITT